MTAGGKDWQPILMTMGETAATVGPCWRRQRRWWWHIPLLVVLACAPYVQTTWSFEFLNWDDDHYIVENQRIRGFTFDNLKKIFTEYYFTDFMPLNLLSLAVDYATGGHDKEGGALAWRFHLTNFLLHAANAVLAYGVLRRILGKEHMALVGAALFAVHPVHAETVAWASERKSLLSGAMFLGAFLLYLEHLRVRRAVLGWPLYVVPMVLAMVAAVVYVGAMAAAKVEGVKAPVMPSAARWLLVATAVSALASAEYAMVSRRGGRWYGAALIVAGAAPFAKPVTLILFPILYMHMLCFEERSCWKRSALEKLPLGAVCVMGAIIGYSAQRFAGTVLPWHGGGPLFNFFTMLPVLPRYLDHFWLPIRQAAVYHPRVFTGMPGGRSLLEVIIGAVAMLALVGAGTLAAIFWRRGAFWLGWIAAALFPVSNLFAPMNTLIADRYLYLPAIGFGALLALGVEPALEGRFGWIKAKTGQRATVLALCAVCLALVLLATSVVRVWRAPRALWTRALVNEPYGAVIRNNLGWVYFDAEQYERARRQLELSVRMERNLHYSQYGLGMVYLRLGMYYEAIPHLERAVALDTRAYAPCFYLAQAYGHVGQRDKEREALEEATRRRPDYFEAWHNLGLVLEGMGRYEEAIGCYRRAIVANPGSLLSYYALALALQRLGRTGEAVGEMRRFLDLAPFDQPLRRRAEQFLATYGGR